MKLFFTHPPRTVSHTLILTVCPFILKCKLIYPTVLKTVSIVVTHDIQVGRGGWVGSGKNLVQAISQEPSRYRKFILGATKLVGTVVEGCRCANVLVLPLFDHNDHGSTLIFS